MDINMSHLDKNDDDNLVKYLMPPTTTHEILDDLFEETKHCCWYA